MDFFLTVGPVFPVIIKAIGIWKSHLMLGLVSCGAAVATAFAQEFWHIIISYSILQGNSPIPLRLHQLRWKRLCHFYDRCCLKNLLNRYSRQTLFIIAHKSVIGKFCSLFATANAAIYCHLLYLSTHPCVYIIISLGMLASLMLNRGQIHL